jgi:hypothetical protein
MVSDYERRLRALEVLIAPIKAAIDALKQAVGYLTQLSSQPRNGGGSSGGYSNITWVYTPAGGIPFATATAGPGSVLSPGSVSCHSGTKDPATGKWTQSATADTTVVNGYTSSTATNAGVGGKWIMVGTEADGTVTCIGDPC